MASSLSPEAETFVPSGAGDVAAQADPKLVVKPGDLLKQFLTERLPIYRELLDLREQGWKDPRADTHFQRQRDRADNADKNGETGIFKLMNKIGHELHEATSALAINRRRSPPHAILDVCMAPGGFTSAAMARNPLAIVRAITLPAEQGGHKILLKRMWSETNPSAKVFVDFRDITMLAEEMGVPVSTIPADHPDSSSFSSDRPFEGQQFDLVFCDGHVLRTHERGEHRGRSEPGRLYTSQYVLALQRIRPGGTLIALLHRADGWRTARLIHAFSQFSSSVQLHKPKAGHKIRSSFYMVAKGVNPMHEAAVECIQGWKDHWRGTTLGWGAQGQRTEWDDDGDGENDEENGAGTWEAFNAERLKQAEILLREFGEEFVTMTEPVFATQVEALKKMPWTQKKKGKGNVNGGIGIQRESEGRAKGGARGVQVPE